MKKNYIKPEIIFEDFTPSTSVAAGCEKIVNASMGQCAVEFAPGLTIFLNGIEGCAVPVEDGSSDFDSVCYHNPSPSNNAFTS